MGYIIVYLFAIVLAIVFGILGPIFVVLPNPRFRWWTKFALIIFYGLAGLLCYRAWNFATSVHSFRSLGSASHWVVDRGVVYGSTASQASSTSVVVLDAKAQSNAIVQVNVIVNDPTLDPVHACLSVTDNFPGENHLVPKSSEPIKSSIDTTSSGSRLGSLYFSLNNMSTSIGWIIPGTYYLYPVCDKWELNDIYPPVAISLINLHDSSRWDIIVGVLIAVFLVVGWVLLLLASG